jgi:hypothetical protein
MSSLRDGRVYATLRALHTAGKRFVTIATTDETWTGRILNVDETKHAVLIAMIHPFETKLVLPAELTRITSIVEAAQPAATTAMRATPAAQEPTAHTSADTPVQPPRAPIRREREQVADSEGEELESPDVDADRSSQHGSTNTVETSVTSLDTTSNFAEILFGNCWRDLTKEIVQTLHLQLISHFITPMNVDTTSRGKLNVSKMHDQVSLIVMLMHQLVVCGIHRNPTQAKGFLRIIRLQFKQVLMLAEFAHHGTAADTALTNSAEFDKQIFGSAISWVEKAEMASARHQRNRLTEQQTRAAAQRPPTPGPRGFPPRPFRRPPQPPHPPPRPRPKHN